MSTSHVTDIFISYAGEDRERARTVARALQALGWLVWWDRDVKTGQAFDQAIEHELETAKRVVVLWSKNSIASDWVKSEAAAALQRGVLLPALIDHVAIPLEFNRRQTADLIDWDGDASHAGFQALCDALAGIDAVAPVATSEPPENRNAPRDASNERLVLKRWWQTLPGILTASAILVAVIAGIVAEVNRARTSNADVAPTAQVRQSTQIPGLTAAPGESTSAAPPAAASTDRDNPTPLTSNEIVGLGIGERVSYYYVFNAGPGPMTAIVDGKNRAAGFTNAIGIELSDIDAKPFLSLDLGNTTNDKRAVKRAQIGRQQQVILRIRLDPATIDYKVRLEGAIDFNRAPTFFK